MGLSWFVLIVNNKLSISKCFPLAKDMLKLFIFFNSELLFHSITYKRSWIRISIYNLYMFLLFIMKKTTDMQWPYADNTFLPLRRRRANTLRPFLVLMRVRKPCTFLRLRLFG